MPGEKRTGRGDLSGDLFRVDRSGVDARGGFVFRSVERYVVQIHALTAVRADIKLDPCLHGSGRRGDSDSLVVGEIPVAVGHILLPYLDKQALSRLVLCIQIDYLGSNANLAAFSPGKERKAVIAPGVYGDILIENGAVDQVGGQVPGMHPALLADLGN